MQVPKGPPKWQKWESDYVIWSGGFPTLTFCHISELPTQTKEIQHTKNLELLSTRWKSRKLKLFASVSKDAERHPSQALSHEAQAATLRSKHPKYEVLCFHSFQNVWHFALWQHPFPTAFPEKNTFLGTRTGPTEVCDTCKPLSKRRHTARKGQTRDIKEPTGSCKVQRLLSTSVCPPHQVPQPD